MKIKENLSYSTIRFLTIVILVMTSSNSQAQVSSIYGYIFPPYDTINILFVFAEVLNDTIHEYTDSTANWSPGKLPTNFNENIDQQFYCQDSITGDLTKLFYSASYGKYVVLGDYVDTLVQIEFDSITSSYGVIEVIDFLDKLPGSYILTGNGDSISSSQFDRFSRTLGTYSENSFTSDGRIDMTAFVFRTNSRITHGNGAGYSGTINKSIKSKVIYDATYLRHSGNGYSTIKHEFAHKLLGGNSFHSGGAGAGDTYYMSDLGGWSVLSSWNKNSEFVNGWDRWWLGWKVDTNTHYVSALNQSQEEVYTFFDSIEIEPNIGDSIFILRDFYTCGDAIRIELPYLNEITSTVRKQYLWIENHSDVDNWEHDKFEPGIYFSIQIGNDDTTSFSSRTNYFSPLCGFGNFDFNYSLDHIDGSTCYYDLETNSNLSNPFTGYHLMMMQAYDIATDSTPNTIYRKEFITYVNDLKYNNTKINTSSNFKSPSLPCLGSVYDVFEEDRILSLSTNPAPVPLLTYNIGSKGTHGSPNPNFDSNIDNRHIFLNGLYIEVLDIDQDGNATIKILCNKWDVENDVRWTGNIVLKDTIYLSSGKTISLDQGLTPTRPNNPITFDGDKVFADPTILSCKNNSLLELNSGSFVDVINNSALILESGSEITIEDGSILHIQKTGTLQIKNGADLNIEGTGQIIVDNGAYICIESGATLNLDDATSAIRLISGYISGLNPFTFSSAGSCSSNPCSYSVSGNGVIICEGDYSSNTYVQDQTFSSDTIVTGKNIYVGYDVTSPPYGNVVINSSSMVVFDAAENITFDEGFETQSGGEIETRNNYHFSGGNLSDPLIIGVLTDGGTYSDTRDNDGYGNNYTGTNNQTSEDIFYQFTILESATATISLCNSDIDDSYVHLLNSAGSWIASNDDCPDDECSEEDLSYLDQSLSAGTYYIVVEGRGNDEGEISLDLTIDY